MKHVGRTATGMLAAGLIAQLGMWAPAAVVFLAVLVLGVICWIIGSPERSDRVIRIILARRGDANCLESATSARK